MIYFSDEAIINGLKEKNIRCLNWLYREYFPLAKSVVEHNSGNYEDAEDVFQDSLVVLYLKARENKLNLNCSLKTFFFSVCRNLWLQRLDRKWRLLFVDNFVQEPSENYESTILGLDEEKLEKTRLYQKHFLSLPADCQLILGLFIQKKTLNEIAKIAGYKDTSYAKTRKYLCKNMLRKRIFNDPKCKHYLIHD